MSFLCCRLRGMLWLPRGSAAETLFLFLQFYAGNSFWVAVDTRGGVQLQRILVSSLRTTPSSRFGTVHEFSTPLVQEIHTLDVFQGGWRLCPSASGLGFWTQLLSFSADKWALAELSQCELGWLEWLRTACCWRKQAWLKSDDKGFLLNLLSWPELT